jgi:hypothetical protein
VSPWRFWPTSPPPQPAQRSIHCAAPRRRLAGCEFFLRVQLRAITPESFSRAISQAGDRRRRAGRQSHQRRRLWPWPCVACPQLVPRLVHCAARVPVPRAQPCVPIPHHRCDRTALRPVTTSLRSPCSSACSVATSPCSLAHSSEALLGTDERPQVALLGLPHSPPIQVIETFDAKETGSTAQAFIFVCAHEGPFI